eukprot:366199-Chlamydomonas_euryale.AAC.25
MEPDTYRAGQHEETSWLTPPPFLTSSVDAVKQSSRHLSSASPPPCFFCCHILPGPGGTDRSHTPS